MAKRAWRKWLKGFLWFFLGLLLLVLLVIAALHTRPAQNFIIGKVEAYLEETLGSDVGIGGFGLGIPRMFQLRDIYVNTPEGDTLARLGHLKVDLDMWALLDRTVRVEAVTLEEVYGNLVTTDSTSNLRFVLDAFAPVDTVTTTAPADTVAAAPWIVDLRGTELQLRQIEVYYQDDPTGLLLDVELGRGVLLADSVDLERQQFILQRLLLEDADIHVGLLPMETPEPPPPAAELLAACEELLLERVAFRLDMDSLQVGTEVPSLRVEQLRATSGATFTAALERLELTDGRFVYDTPLPVATSGFDPNHIRVNGLTADLRDLRFEDTDLIVTVEELQARQEDGLTLERLSGRVDFRPAVVTVEDLDLRTAQSRLSAPLFRYDFPTDANATDLNFRADAQGSIAVSEILMVLPREATSPWLVNHPGARIDLQTRAVGTGQTVNIDRLRLQAPGMDIDARGEVSHPLDPDRLAGSFQLERFEVRPAEVLPLVPDGLLPAHIKWPEQLTAVGNVTYRDNNLDLRLTAREQRRFTPLWTQFTLEGKVLQAADLERARLDLQIDTLLATRESIQGYLPPEALPPGYRIPDYVEAMGSLSGPLDNLNANVRVALPGRTTYVRVLGNVRDAMNPDSLYVDLQITDLQARTADVLPLLPDSLLPPNFKLPDLRIREAYVRGPLDDLTFDLPLATSNGDGRINGYYRPEDFSLDLDLKGTRLAELFTGATRDSILALELQPLRMQIQAAGRIEPVLEADVAVQLTEVERGRVLDLDAQIGENDYQATFAFAHPHLKGTGEANYRLQDSTALVDADLAVEKIDLERWGLSDRPLQGSGSVRVNSIGLDPGRMDGRILLDNIYLRGEGSTSYVDSMLILVNLNNYDNTVTIDSDVLQGELTGYFDPLDIGPELARFFQSYLSEEPFRGDPVVNGKRLELTMKMTNPRPFVSGIIPGLTDLSPFEFSMSYRDRTPALLFDLNLGHLTFSGVTLEGMTVNATGDDRKIAVDADWRNIRVGEDIEIGRTTVESQRIAGGINTTLQVYGEDTIRHRFSLDWLQGGTDQRFVLRPDPIINFSTWNIPTDNAFIIRDSTVAVRNWRLSDGKDRSVLIRDTDRNGLAVTFDDIKLESFSRLVNSEQTLLGGTLNGRVYLDELLTDLGIRADVEIAELAYYEQPLGDLEAEVTSRDNVNFDLNVILRGAGNDLTAGGRYGAGGAIDLELNVDRLQMAALEPFSLGNLTNTEGYLAGRVAVGGSVTEPTLDGQLTFREAALAVSLLGSRYALDGQTIRFVGKTVTFNAFTLRDDNNKTAVLNGTVVVNDLENIGLDLQASMTDFLAVNSTVEDNELFYGKLRLNAEAAITGTVLNPRVIVAAEPSSESSLTYAYTVVDQSRVETTQGVIRFYETYEFAEVVANEARDTVRGTVSGMYLETDLTVNDLLDLRVIVDPITQQEFTGRGNGAINFVQFPTGEQQMTGQVEMAGGTYDMVLEGLQTYTFNLRPGSRVSFTGDPVNPQFDLTITNTVRTSPLPLVQSTLTGTTSTTALRQRETFLVSFDLDGDMQGMNIEADILYPEEGYNNRGLNEVDDALDILRQDQSRVYTTAIMLITFKSFVIPLVDGGNNQQNGIANGIAGAVGDALSQLVNDQLGFVDFSLGVENFQTSSGEQNYNLRLSLQKSFFDDRLVVSVDGVTNTAQDEELNAGHAQTYVDNVSVAYLLDEDGNLRIKLFNDRDRNEFVGGNTIRFGGRLVFSRDFDRFFWEKKR